MLHWHNTKLIKSYLPRDGRIMMRLGSDMWQIAEQGGFNWHGNICSLALPAFLRCSTSWRQMQLYTCIIHVVFSQSVAYLAFNQNISNQRATAHMVILVCCFPSFRALSHYIIRIRTFGDTKASWSLSLHEQSSPLWCLFCSLDELKRLNNIKMILQNI